MIKADQPTLFGADLIVALSSATDGNMKYGVNDDDQTVLEHRRKFLSKNMVALQSTVSCGVTYDTTDFTRYERVRELDRGRGMIPGTNRVIADGIATDTRRCALFLTLADCVGAILYDPKRHALMVTHLGRHSTEQYGAKKSIEFMKYTFGSNPADIVAWLSPAPNGTAYPLLGRDNRSAHNVNTGDLIDAGVTVDNIQVSLVDTVTNQDYFSHSEFIKATRDIDGRYAIVAMMR